MNGRFSTWEQPAISINFYENFNGLDSRAKNRVDWTGSASARRINVNADYGVTWQITPTFGLSDDFRLLVFPSTRDQHLYDDKLRRNFNC